MYPRQQNERNAVGTLIFGSLKIEEIAIFQGVSILDTPNRNRNSLSSLQTF